jgi:peptide/nickel transport system substrate-binding protein
MPDARPHKEFGAGSRSALFAAPRRFYALPEEETMRPRKRRLLLQAGVFASVVAVAIQPGAQGSTSRIPEGGIFRISLEGVGLGQLDYVDPALSYTREGWALLDTTCAHLMSYPDRAAPEGFRIVPEVATGFPNVSRDGKTYTFTLRKGFRFSDGRPVRASAFARAINRTLAPGIRSAAVQYTQDIVGAENVRSGKRKAAVGIVARGLKLVIRFKHPIRDFAQRTTMPFFCAVPPTLPVDPEGVGAFPSAGPYYISEYRPRERVVIRRNRFYGGSRRHHVDGFDVDLRADSPQKVIERVDTGAADWGYTIAAQYFDPSLRLLAKYGINKSQLQIRPGLTLRMLVFNSSRPLFHNNPKLRRAVNFAIDRAVIASATRNPLAGDLTDQLLPEQVPGYREADVYPLYRADVRRARALARGNLRNGKAVLYVTDFPQPVALGQAVKQQLAEIGLDVELKKIPLHVTNPAYLGRLGDPNEPWDMAQILWTPDFLDPYGYINRPLDAQYIGGTNLARFNSPRYGRLMRRAASMRGPARYRAYGALDVRLARYPAPLVPIDFLSEVTFVSKRVGCMVLRPALDLTGVCLYR